MEQIKTLLSSYVAVMAPLVAGEFLLLVFKTSSCSRRTKPTGSL